MSNDQTWAIPGLMVPERPVNADAVKVLPDGVIRVNLFRHTSPDIAVGYCLYKFFNDRRRREFLVDPKGKTVVRIRQGSEYLYRIDVPATQGVLAQGDYEIAVYSGLASEVKLLTLRVPVNAITPWPFEENCCVDKWWTGSQALVPGTTELVVAFPEQFSVPPGKLVPYVMDLVDPNPVPVSATLVDLNVDHFTVLFSPAIPQGSYTLVWAIPAPFLPRPMFGPPLIWPCVHES